MIDAISRLLYLLGTAKIVHVFYFTGNSRVTSAQSNPYTKCFRYTPRVSTVSSGDFVESGQIIFPVWRIYSREFSLFR